MTTTPTLTLKCCPLEAEETSSAFPTLTHIRYLHEVPKKMGYDGGDGFFDDPLTTLHALALIKVKHNGKASDHQVEIRALPIMLAQSEFTPYILLATESDGDTLAGYLAQPNGQVHLDHLQKVSRRALSDTDVAGIVRSVLDLADGLVPLLGYAQDNLGETSRQTGKAVIPTLAHVRYLKEMSKKAAINNDDNLGFKFILDIALREKHGDNLRKTYQRLPIRLAESEFTPYILLAAESDGDTLADYLAQPDGEGHLDHLQIVTRRVLADPDVAGITRSVIGFFDGLIAWQSYALDYMEETPSKTSEAANAEGREGTA